MLPSLAVIGFGQGLGVSPLFGTVLNGVPAEHAGAAGGVLETAAQLGMSLGVTVLGLIFAAGRSAFGAALLGNLGLAVAALLLLPLLYGRRQPRPAM